MREYANFIHSLSTRTASSRPFPKRSKRSVNIICPVLSFKKAGKKRIVMVWLRSWTCVCQVRNFPYLRVYLHLAKRSPRKPKRKLQSLNFSHSACQLQLRKLKYRPGVPYCLCRQRMAGLYLQVCESIFFTEQLEQRLD